MVLSVARIRRCVWRRAVLRGALFALAVWCLFAFELALAIYLSGEIDHAQPADVIIVLGAGLRRDSSPGPALTRRSNHAADLWEQGTALMIICTGGLTGRATRSEASACGEILRARGVPPAAIVLEAMSRSTEENALQVQAIMEAHKWASAVLVSDSFHLPRARWLFEARGLTVYPSPVPASRVRVTDYLTLLGREIVAWHWQAVKQLFNLPQTYVGGL